MLCLSESTKAYLCLEPTDMRRSFDKLSVMASEYVGKDPTSGHMFLFRNRAANRLKILYWDGGSFCLWYKRLDRGSFNIQPGLGNDFEMTPEMFYNLIQQ
jgi:transposase